MCAGSRRIKAFRLSDYRLTDLASSTVDLQHLPLVVVHLTSEAHMPRIFGIFPPGVKHITLGYEDLGAALRQPALAAWVETLAADVNHVDYYDFVDVWPDSVTLPRLAKVELLNCQSPRVAAAVGQRCRACALWVNPALMTFDIETQLELLEETAA